MNVFSFKTAKLLEGELVSIPVPFKPRLPGHSLGHLDRVFGHSLIISQRHLDLNDDKQHKKEKICQSENAAKEISHKFNIIDMITGFVLEELDDAFETRTL